jgi:hypothetical protein
MDTERFTDWTAGAVADAPAETPAQHVRNALTMLSLLEQQSPAFWAFNHELGRAVRRAEAALVILDHDGPPHFVEVHIRRAIETLHEVNLDWEIVTDIPAVVTRLFAAWFAVLAAMEAQ